MFTLGKVSLLHRHKLTSWREFGDKGKGETRHEVLSTMDNKERRENVAIGLGENGFIWQEGEIPL